MIKSLDHIVITCRDMDATITFYTDVLGMTLETFGSGRKALRFGDQKFNLHCVGDPQVTDIYARSPAPGSLDFCLLAALPLDEVVARIARHGVPIELGPTRRTGARWPIRSIYLRDPDGNLVEISERLDE